MAEVAALRSAIPMTVSKKVPLSDGLTGPLLPSSIPYVLELSRRATPEAIQASVARWKTLFSE